VEAHHPRLAAVEAEQRKKPDRLVEVLDDKTDVDEVGHAGAIAVARGQTPTCSIRSIIKRAMGLTSRSGLAWPSSGCLGVRRRAPPTRIYLCGRLSIARTACA
jgi:hypothetical protein